MSNESTISQDELNRLLQGHDLAKPAEKEKFDENAYKSDTKSAADIIRERVAKKLAEKNGKKPTYEVVSQNDMDKMVDKAKSQEKKEEENKPLSQDDIDSILKKLSGKPAATGEKQLRVYDFRNPTKFSQEDKNMMQAVMESFSMKSTERLLSKRKASCRMQFGWNDQLKNSEYFRTLNRKTFIYKITTAFGWFIVEVEPELGWALLKQSKGTSIEQIDLSIMYDYYVRDFIGDFLASIKEKIVECGGDIDVGITEVWKSDETEGANIPKGAVCLINTMHTKVGTRDGYMNILIDSDFFDEMKRHGLESEETESVKKLKTIRKNTSETEFSLEIGRYNLDKDDLKVGELLKLDKSVEETLNLVKDDTLLYECDCIYTTGDLPTSVFGTRICKVRQKESTLKYESGSVAVQLFTVEIPNEKIPELKEGSTVDSGEAYENADELAKLVKDGETIAKGEIVIIDDCFAVKIMKTF